MNKYNLHYVTETDVDINQLEVMVAVSRERSFSRAADVLGRTQPAVSQSIRRLEQELGTKLFDRSSKDGTLTAAGEIVLESARQILSIRQNTISAVGDLKDVKRGKISLSANEHTVFAVLPIISKFQAAHPEIKIEVRRGVASRIPEEIASRQVELGVLSFKPKDPGIVAVGIGTDELVLIVSNKHAFASSKEKSIVDLGSEHFIAHNARSPYRQMVIEAFQRHNIELNIMVELPSLEAIKRLVESGIGIALVPRSTVLSDIENGSLTAISVRELKLSRNLNIVYRKNAVLSHAAREFIAMAKTGIT
ncbi:MAG: LysR family transcriptional regulator [Pyrinomonadaceae bacterium]